MIHSLSEAFIYAAGQGIDPAAFLETVNSALFQSPFYAAYAKVILNPPEHPGATIELGEKDLTLLRQAAAATGLRLTLAEQLAEVFTQARAQGLAQADWAAGQCETAKHRTQI
jgi:3-hydroxyisobutyrate dehydrogenase-like beta-hydroxyacid dehydrogenase